MCSFSFFMLCFSSLRLLDLLPPPPPLLFLLPLCAWWHCCCWFQHTGCGGAAAATPLMQPSGHQTIGGHAANCARHQLMQANEPTSASVAPSNEPSCGHRTTGASGQHWVGSCESSPIQLTASISANKAPPKQFA